jgi:hypothetical protein
MYLNLYVAFGLLVLKPSDMPLTHICEILSSNLCLAQVKLIDVLGNPHESFLSPGVCPDTRATYLTCITPRNCITQIVIGEKCQLWRPSLFLLLYIDC